MERSWTCNYYPLLSQEGAVQSVAATVQEITERTRADGARQDLLDAISQAHSGFILGDDPRRGGTPEGHPALKAFLGLPLHLGDQLIGMIGVANRPGGRGRGDGAQAGKRAPHGQGLLCPRG